MVKCGSLLKSAALAILLVVVAESRSTAVKLATCCTTVTKKEITEPILGFLVQKANHPCVQAVIFQTASGLYCSQVRAPWVRRKITEFKKSNARSTAASPVVTSSSVSLLSVITSTSSPPSPSSSPSPSSPSSSQRPVTVSNQ